MGKIIIQEETSLNPLELMGKEAGVCWNGNVLSKDKNIERAVDCIMSDHGRIMEFPQIYMVIDGYSAKVMREFYTHIGGSPTRVQSSTRYIDYKNFDYVTPKSVLAIDTANDIFTSTMNYISMSLKRLENLGIPREDLSMILPICMTTKVVVRTNLRNLVDMSRKRMCTRAYWEFRELFNDIINALREYSPEWIALIDELNVFHPECEDYGFCREQKGCGRKPKKGDINNA